MSIRGYQSGEMASLGQNAEIADLIHTLGKRNAMIERMLVKMGTKSDTADQRSRMKKEEKDCTKIIKEIIILIKQNSAGDRQVMSRLTKEFDQELNKFQELCRRTEAKEKEIMQAMGADATVEDVENMSDDQKRHRQQQVLDQNIDEQFLEYNEAEIERRHKHILAIEKDALEILEMYKDMKTLVEEQQVNIDVIDNNIQDALANTRQGHEEIVQAEKYQKKARSKQCCLLFIVLAVLAAIVLGAWAATS